jgi:hypothetical protein
LIVHMFSHLVVGKMSDSEQPEITEKDAQLETVVLDTSEFKKQKRNANSLLARLLTQSSCLLSKE